jgi:hypothetical protein
MKTAKHALFASIIFSSLVQFPAAAEVCLQEGLTFYKHPDASIQDTYTKNFEVKDFDRLKVGSIFKINVRPGQVFAVKVSGDREYVDEVLAEVKGGELEITFKEGKTRLRLKNAVTIEVTLPYLRAVNFSGTTNSTIHPGFTTSNFVAYISGTANAEITMESQEMYLDVSGAANLKITGKSDKLKVNTDGTSGLDAFNLTVTDATVDVSGTSGAKINASGSIKANASGAASIKYKGDAKVASMNTSKLSTVKKVD